MAFMWMITGEHPVFRRGVFQPVKPCRNLWEGGWGGLGLTFRYDRFIADKGVYDHLIYEGNSVRGAKAYSVALNWYLNPIIRLILDATRTDFSEPLLISRDALKGTSIYSDREFVFTSRFQLVF
jgi:phosphate-selective porin